VIFGGAAFSDEYVIHEIAILDLLRRLRKRNCDSITKEGVQQLKVRIFVRCTAIEGAEHSKKRDKFIQLSSKTAVSCSFCVCDSGIPCLRVREMEMSS